MQKNDLYPHVFQPLTIRGLTLKNRLQYAPTVVLKCSPEGDVVLVLRLCRGENSWPMRAAAAIPPPAIPPGRLPKSPCPAIPPMISMR